MKFCVAVLFAIALTCLCVCESKEIPISSSSSSRQQHRKGAPESSPNYTPYGTPPYNSPNYTPDDTPYNSPNYTPYDTPYNSPNYTPDDTPYNSPNYTPSDTPNDTPNGGKYMLAIVKSHGRTAVARIDLENGLAKDESLTDFTFSNTCSLSFSDYIDYGRKRGAMPGTPLGGRVDAVMWSIAFNDTTGNSQRQLFGADLHYQELVDRTGSATVGFDNAHVFFTDYVHFVMDVGGGYLYNVTRDSYGNAQLNQFWSLSSGYGNECSVSFDSKHSTIWSVCGDTIVENNYKSLSSTSHENTYNIQVAAFDRVYGELIGLAAAVDSTLVFSMSRQNEWEFLGVVQNLSVVMPNPQLIVDSHKQQLTFLAKNGPNERLATVDMNTLNVMSSPLVSETILSFCYAEDGYMP